MKRSVLWLVLGLLWSVGCSSAPTTVPTQAVQASASTAPPTATATLKPSAPPLTAALPAAPSFTPSTITTPGAAVTPTVTPTPTEPSGTIIQTAGENLVLSHPDFYWSLKLPRDWMITEDTGFEVSANNPNKTAFLHLLSQTWLTKDRKPEPRAYVEYWKNTELGNIFPVFAEGELVSETEIGDDKFGGPYLRYEFDDGDAGVRYLQVYASRGGPNSIVLTLWAKRTDFENVQGELETILNSVELVEEK